MGALLDICIPTYNRAVYLSKLLSQLSEFLREQNLGDQVRVFVSDNCSTDDTAAVMRAWQVEESSWRLESQGSNIGMMQNFQYLLEKSDAEYVWLFGDDDSVDSARGLSEIVAELKNHRPGLLLLIDEPQTEQTIFYGRRFDSAQQFVEHYSAQSPDFFREMTWISANIFERKIFDQSLARMNVKGWYMHSYGIYGGLATWNPPVRVASGHYVTGPKLAGARETNFPGTYEIGIEWWKFYAFLAERFNQPALQTFAGRWAPSRFHRLRITHGYLRRIAKKLMTLMQFRPRV